jgi:hypothetical protein
MVTKKLYPKMKNMIRVYLLFAVQLMSLAALQAQAVIGYQALSPNPSLMLEVYSDNKGVALPAFQLLHPDSASPVASPATGLLMFNVPTSLSGLQDLAPFYWGGSSWKMLQSAGRVWGLLGNPGTSPGFDKLGTTDNVDVVFRRNNVKSGVLGATNTAFGNGSLLNTASGSNNTALGANALAANTTGTSNTAQGVDALAENTTGILNTAFGYGALALNTDGSYNTAAGAYALYGMNGNNNTALGYNAIGFSSTGSKNTAIGYNAQVGNGLTYATAIGANANVTASNSLVLGGTGTSAVQVGFNTWSPDADLEVNQKRGDTAGIRLWYSTLAANWRFFTDSASRDLAFHRNGVLRGYINNTDGKYYATSDVRLKTDIASAEGALDKVLKLQPVTYHYIDNPAGSQKSYGFIAQEVEKVFPEFVTTKEESGLKGIAYDNFGVVAIKAAQEQQTLIETQRKRLETIKQRIAKLEAKK